jgi:alpha-L-rhamnosidase
MVIGPHPVAPWTHLVPVRTRIVYEPVHAVSLTKLPSGSVVADFGQVYAGIPSVTFHLGVPGRPVIMHAGFLLDQPAGTVSTTSGTQHTDMSYSYVQRGLTETFRPFDYLAFRYLQIDDPGESFTPADVVLLTRHVAVPDEHAGTFTSSDPTVDAVYSLGTHSALFTMQEQFVDTPTREKGSWLGDGRNESLTAMDAFGDSNMTRKSLLEFAQSQARFWPDGGINKLYPTSLGAMQIPEGTAMYVDWVWEYWMHTGDRAALAAVYPAVDKVTEYFWRARNPATGLLTGVGGPGDATAFPTDTALNVMSVNVMRRAGDMATALGRPATEANRQHLRAEALTAAINAHLVGRDGAYYVGLNADGTPIVSGTNALNAASRQSDNAYALRFGVVPRERAGAVARYVASQRMATPPIFAGDLLEALHTAGDDQTLLRLINDKTQPGWANILARGGTFGWEVWNPADNDVVVGGTPLGSFFGNGDTMSHGFSSNVVVAIQQALLGVVPTAPGFSSFTVTPPPHVLTFAAGTVPTPHGTITVRWHRPAAGGPFTLDVTVPANTTASVHVPAGAASSVKVSVAGGADPGRAVELDGGYAVVTLGGGTYHLSSATEPPVTASPVTVSAAAAEAPGSGTGSAASPDDRRSVTPPAIAQPLGRGRLTTPVAGLIGFGTAAVAVARRRRGRRRTTSTA